MKNRVGAKITNTTVPTLPSMSTRPPKKPLSTVRIVGVIVGAGIVAFATLLVVASFVLPRLSAGPPEGWVQTDGVVVSTADCAQAYVPPKRKKTPFDGLETPQPAKIECSYVVRYSADNVDYTVVGCKNTKSFVDQAVASSSKLKLAYNPTNPSSAELTCGSHFELTVLALILAIPMILVGLGVALVSSGRMRIGIAGV